MSGPKSDDRRFSVVAMRGDRSLRRPDAETSGGADLTLPSDPLNREIVRLLEDDGRRPLAEIALALGVSEGTIRNRVNGMRNAGHLRIVALVDPKDGEYRAAAMIGVKVAQNATPADVAARLAACDAVVYILWVSGRYDLLVEVLHDAPEHLLAFLETHIHGQQDIAAAETMSGLKNFKNQFLLKRNWP